jgi:hypothetical protein
MHQTEYAPEYSHAERVRLVVLGLVAGSLVISACQLWFFPALREFSQSADCRTVFGFSGVAALYYGVFVGVPTFAALLVGMTVGRRGVKVLRQERVPPLGEKVFRRTEVIRGSKARLLGYVQLFAAAPLLALALWGAFQAQANVDKAQQRPARCEPNISFHATAYGRA